MVFGGELNGEDFFQACRTLGEHHHAVGKTDGFGNIMRDEDGGFSFLADNRADFIRNGKPCLIIQCGKRLIQKENIGTNSKCADECRALAHTA